MKMNRSIAAFLLTLAAVALPLVARAADEPTPMENKAAAFLLSTQGKEGAWLAKVGPAVTAMVVKGLVQNGKSVDDPAVAKALDFIASCKQKDGGYYVESNPNYNSSIVLSMYASLPGVKDGKYAAEIKGLQTFLMSLQQVEGKKDAKGNVIDKKNSWYGGAGYGEDRPDLSNTAFFIEALHDSGVPATDPAIQKALVFVSRTQMNSETNDQDFAKGAPMAASSTPRWKGATPSSAISINLKAGPPFAPTAP